LSDANSSTGAEKTWQIVVDIVKPDGTFAAYIGYPYRSGRP
jgi:hypothetical protein